MCVWAPDNGLGAGGAAALAGALGKLVQLTSLNLDGMRHGGVVCVACVYVCRAVSECAWEVVAVRGCMTHVQGLGVWAPDNGLGAQTKAALDVTRPASERAAAVRDLPADDAVRLALLEHDARLWPFFPEECAAFLRAAQAASHASRGPPNGASTALLSPDAPVPLDTPHAQHDADTCLVGPLSAVAASLQAAVACVPSPTEPVSSPEDLEAVVTAAARLVAACERAVEDAKAYETAVEEQLRASYERRAAARQAALLQLVEVTAGARAQVEDAVAAVARAVDEGEVANIKRAAEERGEARASAR